MEAVYCMSLMIMATIKNSNVENPCIIYTGASAINVIEFSQQYQHSNQTSFPNLKALTIEKHDIVFGIGMSNGEMCILQLVINEKNMISADVLFSYIAHPPVNSDDPVYRSQFGSIHRASDIWSCVFSPCGNYLATCSEDQTTKIWDISNKYSLIKVLTGHKAAVTCVDWTILENKEKKEMMATCSDDRVIMLWNIIRNKINENDETEKNETLEFVLLQNVQAKTVFGWFTFTYLRFQRDSNKLSVGTENGTIVIFQIDELWNMSQIFCRCLHRGSIEGLQCDKHGYVVSCGSDCSVVVLKK